MLCIFRSTSILAEDGISRRVESRVQMNKTTPDKHDQLLLAISQVVREKREGLGLTQEELAQKAGLHRTYISDIERGARNLSVRSLISLADALGVCTSKLVLSSEERAGLQPAEHSGSNGEVVHCGV